MKKIFLLLSVLASSLCMNAQNIKYVEAVDNGRLYRGIVNDEWSKVDSIVITGEISGDNNAYFSDVKDLAQFFDLTGLNLANCKLKNDEIHDWTFFPTGINSGAKSDRSDVRRGYTHIKTEERYFRVNLKHVTFPEGLKSIRERAFFRCNLEEVDLPSSVSLIEAAAFDECCYMKSMTVHVMSPGQIDISRGYGLKGLPEDIILYVPKGAKSAFEADEQWSKVFKTVIELDDLSGIDNVTSAIPVSNRIYTLDGRYVGTDINALAKGMYIVNGKKILK